MVKVLLLEAVYRLFLLIQWPAPPIDIMCLIAVNLSLPFAHVPKAISLPLCGLIEAWAPSQIYT